MPAPDATAAHPSARSLAWLAAAAAAAVLVTAVATAAMTHSSLPHEDEWYSLDLYAAALRGDFLPRLLSQHNEHRIAFPRLLFWTDYALLDGTGRVDLAATFVVQGLEACLLAWVAAKAGVGTALTLATGAMATVLLFSLRQYENLTWGFQTQFVGVFAAASLAVALHARSMAAPDGRGAAWPLLAALGMTFVATYTMANGLLGGVRPRRVRPGPPRATRAVALPPAARGDPPGGLRARLRAPPGRAPGRAPTSGIR